MFQVIEIPLTKGKVAIIDDDDVELVSNNKWCFQSPGYAARRKNKKIDLMHRVIIGAKPGEQVDHINGNRLDNRRSNLRIANNSENSMNKGVQSNNTSGYKGVSWNQTKQKWHAYIYKEGKRIHLGYFRCKHEAARKYNENALIYHKEYAKLNAIEEDCVCD